MSATADKKPFDPFQVAMTASVAPKSANRDSSPSTPPKISEVQQQVWASGGDNSLDMSIPVDGWNALHYRCHFARLFRKVYGHMYPGKIRLDNQSFGAILTCARQELEMSNSEIVDFLDWSAKTRMPWAKSTGQIYLSSALKEDLKEFYMNVISVKKIADSTSKIPQRDLVIDPKDLRVAFHGYMERGDNNEVIGFDNRLLMQFGIAMIAYYLEVQEGMDADSISKMVLLKIDSIVKEDASRSTTAISPRFERIIKSSIAWEPYPWRAIKWRESSLRKAIEFFGYTKQPWWKENATVKRNFASCLKVFKSKKKEF